MKRKHRILLILFTLTFLLCTASSVSAKEKNAVEPVLVPQPLPANDVAANPYMSDSDNPIHNDVYSSDVTDAVMPLGMFSQLRTSIETQNIQAPSAAFYDGNGNAVTPFLGGISIVEMDHEKIVRKGSFVPKRDDEGEYALQISYSFVDSHNHVVAPTSNGHILVIKTTDENGEILPVFEKLADIDVVSEAVKKLGPDIDKRLLSTIYDYDGNLWFVTGGFRIDPDRDPAGFIGYISRDYMEKIENGSEASLEDHLFVHPLDKGEGAENGISANEDGAVILTNSACYMLTAKDGVNVKWRTPYESNGANDAQEGSGYTGGGLAWGSGTTPTLTRDLVLFTDNLDPVNLLALSSKTGEIVAQTPVLDQLEKDTPVSVENSILVYSAGDGSASVIVCNWFGAGNANLANPDADSSIQSYENIYDENWTKTGNEYIAPGVERVDFIKGDKGYQAEKVWLRKDIRDTSMIKLSTATGYLYGYWQNMDSGMWGYEVLDFDTGKTLLRADVSELPGYNNMAVGVIADEKGNTLYCPTNCMEMVYWQDEFAYLPDCPAKKIPLSAMERYHLTEEETAQKGMTGYAPACYLMTVNIENLYGETELALRLNGLDRKLSEYELFYREKDGSFQKLDDSWKIYGSDGKEVSTKEALNPKEIYEIRFPVSEQAKSNLAKQEKLTRVSVVLAQKK